MRIPYGYILEDGQFVLDESKAFVVRMIFAYYLAGASLGKVTDLLFEKGIFSPQEMNDGHGLPLINFSPTQSTFLS